jgi:ribonuclease HI
MLFFKLIRIYELLKLLVYTDGSVQQKSLRHAVIGSYGFISELVEIDRNTQNRHVINTHSQIELSDKSPINSTISEMEISALIIAMDYIASLDLDAKTHIELYTDSKNTVDSIEKYIPNWIKKAKLTSNPNVWLASNGNSVANQELLQEMYNKYTELRNKFKRFQINHVKAHDVSEKNNLIDELCYKKIEDYFANMN